MEARTVAAFATGWSMQHPLPNGEARTQRDLVRLCAGYRHALQLRLRLPRRPSDPLRIRNQVLQWTIDRVRYMQENRAIPQVGWSPCPAASTCAKVPVVGRDDLHRRRCPDDRDREPVAFGNYASTTSTCLSHRTGQRVRARAMGAIISANFPDLLIPGPISTEHLAYNTAVRMEPVRANTGGAAGVMAAVALARAYLPHRCHTRRWQPSCAGNGIDWAVRPTVPASVQRTAGLALAFLAVPAAIAAAAGHPVRRRL